MKTTSELHGGNSSIPCRYPALMVLSVPSLGEARWDRGIAKGLCSFVLAWARMRLERLFLFL